MKRGAERADERRDGTADPVAPEPRRESLADAAVPAAAWAFVFLILRVFAVSGYDWNTAFAVSTTLGLDDGFAILFGSFMAGHLVLSLVLVFVLPLLVATWIWAPDGRRPSVALTAVLALVTAIALTLSFERWWLALATLVTLAAFAATERLPTENRLRRGSAAAMRRVGAVGAMALLLVAVLTSTPWVPRERIETVDGPLDGYVLSVDSGYLNVLTDEQRFVIVLGGDVLSRE